MPAPERPHTPAHEPVHERPGPRGIRPRPIDDPARQRPKPLGVPVSAPAGAGAVGLLVPDARHHVHVIGVTGVGKSTWLAHHAIAEAEAGRGLALLDVQGDLAQAVLHRLPAACADRLILLEPGDTAPPGWNPLHPDPGPPPETHASPGHAADPAVDGDGGLAGGAARAGEWNAEGVVSVFRRSASAWWGPRMDDVARAVCLTLVRRPDSTIGDIPLFLTSQSFRAEVLAGWGEPPALAGYWTGYDQLTPSGRAQLTGPLLARVRALLARSYARDLLDVPRSTLDLGAVLDGGILVANLAKGALGDEVSRLVGSLLLTGLWAQATRRANRAPEQRPDATIMIDEAHNLSHLPIGLGDALAELRGYRVSLVLAHQHLGQLPADIAQALAANARNKVVMTVSPEDARELARHFTPVFDDYDLAHRPPFSAAVRIVHQGHDLPPFSLRTLQLSDVIPGRATMLRAAARANAGLDRQRHHQHDRLRHQLPGAVRDPAPAHPADGSGAGDVVGAEGGVGWDGSSLGGTPSRAPGGSGGSVGGSVRGWVGEDGWWS